MCDLKRLVVLLHLYFSERIPHFYFHSPGKKKKKKEKNLIFILTPEKLLVWNKNYLFGYQSLRKCQALARFASQNRNPYFKINLKYISEIVQIGQDLSSQYRQARLIIKRQACALGNAFDQGNSNYLIKMSISACNPLKWSARQLSIHHICLGGPHIQVICFRVLGFISERVSSQIYNKNWLCKTCLPSNSFIHYSSKSTLGFISSLFREV